MVYCGVVGHPVRHEQTVIGDSVNVAARLMGLASGQIFCDLETKAKATIVDEGTVCVCRRRG